ncbi:unnamed protein product [Mesocestoides corti]|uniref:Integrator complex subunit 11 n=1 Tax=Mesocestoides corti TaxID=53468 RepID=A0A3P6I8L3_MESCO|nr:unnamed protein product [Mesocestoides corti]
MVRQGITLLYVGRSCILVSIGGKNIMLDCGMHMGYNDERRFPDFSFIVQKHDLTEYLNCVIISHFHLDHCGALPYMTEMVGYNGPIYMTHPTKAICPILLVIFLLLKGVENRIFSQHFMPVMFWELRFFTSKLETGDYNMTPDRHLGSAWVPRCRPDLLITETTYATTIRDSKRAREREFLEKVHSRLDAGGKVLIPVFALGRAQELCILLETYWERMSLSFPIYFSAGMAEKATEYYKLFISWTSQKIKETFVERNMFDFKHIRVSGGCLMLWTSPARCRCTFSANGKQLYAYLQILNGAKRLEFDKQTLEVCMRVEYLSFSAHADARGIMQLISQCRPGHVLLVHGEPSKMEFLKGRIESETGLECSMPANGEIAVVPTRPRCQLYAPAELLRAAICKSSCTSVSFVASAERQDLRRTGHDFLTPGM